MPPGWEAHADEHGATYYYHAPSGTSSWEPPKNQPPTQPSPPASLPPGWEVHRDETGTPYYYNHQTRETTWDRPRLAAATARGNGNGYAEPRRHKELQSASC